MSAVRMPETPEDFRVDEVALYPPSGEGGHTFLRIEKRGRTTEEAVREVARQSGSRPRDIGYAGRKDKRAITTQWISVPDLDPERALAIEADGVRVLEAARHPHKLRTGHLAHNRFDLVIREVDDATYAGAVATLDAFALRGMPNRFGGQRFGRDGDNAAQGRAILAGEHAPRDRRKARFLVSALQSAVFNQVLSARARIDRLETGDVAVVHESGGQFVVESSEIEGPRAERFEISPTGPIFGTKVIQPAGAVAEREQAALEAFGIPVEGLRPPRGISLRGARRALRVRPDDACILREGDAVRIRFSLRPGSYATVLLEELFPVFPDDSGP
jgi:tRNA pseudouridine13 synthase